MDYNTFTVEELKKECKKKDISGYSKLRKNELIELLMKNNKNTELYYYTDQIYFLEIMIKRKEWKYLPPEKKGKNYYTDKIIEEGKWNLYLKPTPFISLSPKFRTNLYYLPKPNKDILQIVNHFPNIEGIGTKSGLVDALSKYKSEFKNIFQESFIINSSNDKNFSKILQSKNKYWIVKPDNEYGGLGVKFFDNSLKTVQYIQKIMKTGLQIKDYRKKYEKREIKKEKWIIQKYIANPFLYKGKKFDIRIHLLIRDTGEIYFSKYGYLNVSSVPFKLEVGKNDNESGLIHITNPIYQEKSEQDGNQDDNSISLEKFIEYLQEVYGKKEGKILYNNLLNDWKNISRLLIERTWDVINKKTKEIPNRRYYELIGLDIMIDDKFNSWLIEANFNPGLGNLTIEEEKIVPQMIEETIKICVDPIFGGKVPKKLKWFEEI